jgi:hypothetical protein
MKAKLLKTSNAGKSWQLLNPAWPTEFLFNISLLQINGMADG